MAIQKFALYDLIVDIIPGAILVVILYSVAPEGLYQPFFGINPSLVPGIAVILFSYPVGRIFVHGVSSKFEDRLLSVIYTIGLDGTGDSQVDDWLVDPEITPSDVSSPVVQDVSAGLYSITGPVTDTEALRRYGENVLFPRDTLYGKYEILSTFYRHMTFLSACSFVIYFSYASLRVSGQSLLPDVSGSAPISDWPLYILLLATLIVFLLCQWQWKGWTKSKNRAFVNDLHTYLREQDLISREEESQSSSDPS